MTDHRVNTPDGRTLQVLESADPDGVPVVFLQGTPNSRLVYQAWVDLAERRRIRLITYDRPGYGGSNPNPGRTVADCEVDLRAIAAALSVERMGVYGVSGGGPHAIAAAALLGDLVPAVGVLASPAPWNAPGLDYFAGMGEDNVKDGELLQSDPDTARAKWEADRLELLALTGPQLLEAWQSLLAPVDAALATGEYAAFCAASFRDGLGPGSQGWWDDSVAIKAPWGFELSAIRTPVLLLHGHHDRFVPVAHGQWLADRIPGVEARIAAGDGHLTLTENHLAEIFDWLLDRI